MSEATANDVMFNRSTLRKLQGPIDQLRQVMNIDVTNTDDMLTIIVYGETEDKDQKFEFTHRKPAIAWVDGVLLGFDAGYGAAKAASVANEA